MIATVGVSRATSTARLASWLNQDQTADSINLAHNVVYSVHQGLIFILIAKSGTIIIHLTET
jgi:hypothetical protein